MDTVANFGKKVLTECTKLHNDECHLLNSSSSIGNEIK